MKKRKKRFKKNNQSLVKIWKGYQNQGKRRKVKERVRNISKEEKTKKDKEMKWMSRKDKERILKIMEEKERERKRSKDKNKEGNVRKEEKAVKIKEYNEGVEKIRKVY